jgi:hypothetical protein
LAEPKDDEMDSIGRWVKQLLGDKLYAIGFVAHWGTGRRSNAPISFGAPLPNSLEDQSTDVAKIQSCAIPDSTEIARTFRG